MNILSFLFFYLLEFINIMYAPQTVLYKPFLINKIILIIIYIVAKIN
jgi:hypothetical protein